MNFKSEDNPYVLDYVDHTTNMVMLWVGGEHATFKFKGHIRFFNDSNGVGDSWVDYEHDIKLELQTLLSDPIIRYDKELVVQLLATEEFKTQYS